MDRFVNIIAYIEEFNSVSILLRLLCAAICGGVLGLERGRANQAAGMRTYMLVCFGSTLVMLTGEYLFSKYDIGDPARLGAQVISGVGFLGAGSIILEGRTRVRGLTTAAGLWTAACIGLAIGIGFFIGGIAATVLAYLAVTKLKPISDHFTHNDLILHLYIEFAEIKDLNSIFETIESFGFLILDKTVNNSKNLGYYNMIISIKSQEMNMEEQTIEFLKKIQEVHKVKVLPY